MVSLCALFIPSQCVQNDITIIHKFWLRLQTLSSTRHRQHTILFADYMITRTFGRGPLSVWWGRDRPTMTIFMDSS